MKIKISANQLFASIVLLPLGSAALFFITPEAKQDAWIAILIYIIPAVFLQIVYTSLWKKYPQDSIVTYMPKIFGKVIGYTLSVIYTVYFAYDAARIIRDITELIVISVMPKMSYIIIAIVLILVIGHSCFLGIENICRATYIFLYMWVFFFILEWVFLCTTPDALKFYNLEPALENGIIPVIKEGWKLITFPYGETIVFTMFFPYIVEISKVRKAAVFGIIFQGILLSLNTIMFIAVLGINYASTSLFPMLQTLRIMQIGETFDRVDIFIVLVLIIIGYIKASFFMYAAMLGTAKLIKSKDTKYLAIPFSIVILITSLLIAKNYPEHIYIGLVLTLIYVHLPLAVFIPIIALLVYYIRNFIKNKE